MIAVKKGDRVSEYILEEPLGRGGFGEVWRARHYMWADRQVAVKIPTSPEAVKSLANEGLLQSSLSHPGIAQPLGMDTAGDPPYFITEFVEGKNLREVLADGPLDPDRTRDILEHVLAVLEYAHTEKVVHQDIKPENIMITPEGDVKLTDFGLGQTVSGESILLSVSLRSEDQSVAGTFPYIAPEIRDGEGPIDGRVDLYSLGIVIFEMLTGQRPVGGEVPSDLREGLPSWCDAVFRGLYTRRDSRFENVAAVRETLQSYVSPAPVTPAAPATNNGGPRVTPLVSPQDRLVPADRACKELGISRRELRHWIRRGFFNPVSLSGNLFLEPEEVADFRRQHPTIRLEGGEQVKVEAHVRADRSARRAAPQVKAVAGQKHVAGLLPRTVAMILDFAVLSMALAPFSPVSIGTLFTAPVRWVPVIGNMAPLIVVFLYFALATGLFGRTVGKAAMGLRVVRLDGQPVTVFDGFVRTINYLASLLPFGMGFLAVLFSERKLAFHDLLCGTQVIYET